MVFRYDAIPLLVDFNTSLLAIIIAPLLVLSISAQKRAKRKGLRPAWILWQRLRVARRRALQEFGPVGSVLDRSRVRYIGDRVVPRAISEGQQAARRSSFVVFVSRVQLAQSHGQRTRTRFLALFSYSCLATQCAPPGPPNLNFRVKKTSGAPIQQAHPSSQKQSRNPRKAACCPTICASWAFACNAASAGEKPCAAK